MYLTPTFLLLLKSHVSVAPPPAKHPFNDPSTALISTMCPGSPLQGSTQVTTVIARSNGHLLNDSISNDNSPRCFLCSICATKNGFPFEAQLMAHLKTNFFFIPLKTVCAGWKLS